MKHLTYALFLTFYLDVSIQALTLSMTRDSSSTKSIVKISRRNALIQGSASIAGLVGASNSASAELLPAETVDLSAIKAAQSKKASAPGIMSSTGKRATTIIPIKDPSPLLSIRGGIGGKSTIKIPRVGYSFYKTAPDQAARCAALALRAGVRHFDVASSYGSNSQIAIPLKKFLDIGMTGMDSFYKDEKPEILQILDDTKKASDEHSVATVSSGIMSGLSPPPSGSAGRKGRRDTLFISHKLSNAEQSSHRVDVKRAVKAQIAELGCTYLDMVSMHSPLTDKSRRMESYASLLELRDGGFVKSVGVCNYGVCHLEEIKDSGLDLPSVNQLELSPFNTHTDVISWCEENGVAVSCAAWSKLSGADGPADQWAVIADIAKNKGMTKAQVMVRWALQKGYICVPRSAAASKIERIAIAENSYGGVNSNNEGSFVLSDEEMSTIEGLNIDYKAGKLGRRDGWTDEDVTGLDWDPTSIC